MGTVVCWPDWRASRELLGRYAGSCGGWALRLRDEEASPYEESAPLISALADSGSPRRGDGAVLSVACSRLRELLGGLDEA